MRKALGYLICGVSSFTIGYLYAMLIVGGASTIDETCGTNRLKDALRPYEKMYLKLTGVKDN